MNEILIAIIGGGIIGYAVAMELSLRYQGIFLFEKNPGITRGENQSRKGIPLCGGKPAPNYFCRNHHVTALNTGKLIVATTLEEDQILDIYLSRAMENEVPGVKKIPGRIIRELELNARAQIRSGGLNYRDCRPHSITLIYRHHTIPPEWGTVYSGDQGYKTFPGS